MWGAGSGVREWQRPITRENWLVFLISLVRTKEGLVAFLSPIALAAYLKRKLSPGEAWSTLGVLVLAGMEGTWQCQGLAGARFPENLFHCGDLPAPQGILFSGSPSILLISSPLAVSPPSPSRSQEKVQEQVPPGLSRAPKMRSFKRGRSVQVGSRSSVRQR